MDPNLKKFIIHALKKHYPLPISFNNIKNLSHFVIKNINNSSDIFLPFCISIRGVILDGEYKDYKIIKVVTKYKKLDWNKYISLYIFLLRIYLLHTYNKILTLEKMVIKKNNNIIEYKIKYTKNPSYKLIWEDASIVPTASSSASPSHFYLNSFSVCQNHAKLKIEIDRLIKNRDEYNSIYFHLDNNGGGDIVPAHLILRCLVGKKESWMKNIKKMLTNKKISEWDCWKEEAQDSPNYKVVNMLNLDKLPNYNTKYNGKIYVYMNKKNGSAAWFFITYLIYAFSKKVNRFSKNGIKYGTIESDQLKLYGQSGTTSGDGNTIDVKYKNIKISIPTEQFISCSIKKVDWNRIWIE